MSNDKIIIANCSGFLGDRFSAAQEMISGGPIDVLTGDYLAELTMAILFRLKSKDPAAGYASTFLKQMEGIMGECLDKKIKVVSNAGGLNPAGLAAALEKVADELGLKPKIAYIVGDDLHPRLKELQEKGEEFVHMDKGIPLAEGGGFPLTANAYLGCWGIAEALKEGADIVVGGRLADAALVSGPAAWKFDWKKDDWDRLAGAVIAGHVIECGAQATGGNYSFIDEVPSFKNVGFPIAEVFEDGSSVITKHPGTGGLVSPDTVKAQLLYEIREPGYLTPDCTARFDTIEVAGAGADRVSIKGAKGGPPTDKLKVCINTMGGFRNTMTVILTGLDIEEKARIVEEALFDRLGGKDQFAVADVKLIRSHNENPATNEEAFSYLRISVMDPDKDKVGRTFSSAVVELALANIPGFNLTAPPDRGMPAIKHWPALISSKNVTQSLSIDGKDIEIAWPPGGDGISDTLQADADIPAVPGGPSVSTPLGHAFAARSGDKGGNANLGVWGKDAEAYAFLKDFLTIEKLKELLADVSGYEMERYELPNLLALNFYIKGILGDGVAASTRLDGQAKTLGEYLRAKVITMPESIVIKK